jgi:antitoxin component YwqK of YwqJK toxin-antitoxin module
MKSLFRSSFLFLLLLTSPVFAQQLQLKITGYDALVHHGGNQYSFMVHLDTAGKKQGPVTIYEKKNNSSRSKADSVIVFRGTFRDSHFVDSATWYYPNGRKMRVTYLDRTWSDKWSETSAWYEFGGLKIDGKVQGAMTEWYDLTVDGKQPVKLQENYVDGKRDGKRQQFYASGQIKEEKYLVMGVFEGRYTSWFENGKIEEEGNYKKGGETGEWRYYWQNGNLKRRRATHLPVDTITNYHENGKVKDQTFYRNYRPDGDYFEYDTLGMKAAYRHFRNGKQDSVQIGYYPSGAKSEVCYFKNGKRAGQYQAWYANGKIKTDGQYDDGSASGIWRKYGEDGTLLKTINYDERDGIIGEMDGSKDTDGNFGQEDVEAMQAYDFSFILPAIKYASKPHIIAKDDKMKFLKSHEFIDMTAVMDSNGKISYTMVSPLTPEDREKFTAYMTMHFATGRQLLLNGKPTACTMTVRVLITPI